MQVFVTDSCESKEGLRVKSEVSGCDSLEKEEYILLVVPFIGWMDELTEVR